MGRPACGKQRIAQACAPALTRNPHCSTCWQHPPTHLSSALCTEQAYTSAGASTADTASGAAAACAAAAAASGLAVVEVGLRCPARVCSGCEAVTLTAMLAGAMRPMADVGSRVGAARAG